MDETGRAGVALAVRPAPAPHSIRNGLSSRAVGCLVDEAAAAGAPGIPASRTSSRAVEHLVDEPARPAHRASPLRALITG
ncbi:MAG: hypothetical protein OXG35_04955, partial [Acidobacteria bacterium]|nr:hypothetical protein [Acidobacteriota bacterium]